MAVREPNLQYLSGKVRTRRTKDIDCIDTLVDGRKLVALAIPRPHILEEFMVIKDISMSRNSDRRCAITGTVIAIIYSVGKRKYRIERNHSFPYGTLLPAGTRVVCHYRE